MVSSVVTPWDVLLSAVRLREADSETDVLEVASSEPLETAVDASELSVEGVDEASTVVNPTVVDSPFVGVVKGRVVVVVSAPWWWLLLLAAVTFRLHRFSSQQATSPVQSCAGNNKRD